MRGRMAPMSFQLKGGFKYGGRNYTILFLLFGVLFSAFFALSPFIDGNFDAGLVLPALLSYTLGFASLWRMRKRQAACGLRKRKIISGAIEIGQR
jgi:hypothetical protein